MAHAHERNIGALPFLSLLHFLVMREVACSVPNSQPYYHGMLSHKPIINEAKRSPKPPGNPNQPFILKSCYFRCYELGLAIQDGPWAASWSSSPHNSLLAHFSSSAEKSCPSPAVLSKGHFCPWGTFDNFCRHSCRDLGWGSYQQLVEISQG